MSLFFWYVSWASWWNAVLLCCCSSSKLNRSQTSTPLCPFWLLETMLHSVFFHLLCGLWFWIAGEQFIASVTSCRVESSVFAWNTSRPYQTRCGWEHSGNAYHFWEKKTKKSIYYSKHALHKYPTVRYNYKNMTAGTEQRALRCQRGKPGKPNKHFIKCKTTSLNFKSFISWLLAHIAATSVQMQVGSKSEQHARCCSRPIIYFANVQHLLCIWVWCGIQSGCVLQD